MVQMMTRKLEVSPKAVAEKTGLSAGYISKVFSGKRIPRVHNFKRIADALRLTMEDLYNHLKKFYEGKR